jgi:DNA-binding IclR family transcriptional regulator
MSEELRTLKRIELLLETIAKTAVAEKLAKVLENRKHQILYENDGRLSVKELAKRTGFSVGKISGLWRQWEQEGLLVKDGKSYRRVF